MLGRCEGVLNQSQADPSGSDSPPTDTGPWAGLRAAAAMICLAALLGSFLGLSLSAVSGWDSPLLAAEVGGGFGGIVGLVIAVLVGFVRRLRMFRGTPRFRMTTPLGVIGAVSGAFLYPPFPEDFAI